MKKIIENSNDKTGITDIINILIEILNSSQAQPLLQEDLIKLSDDKHACIDGRIFAKEHDNKYLFSDIIIFGSIFKEDAPTDPCTVFCVKSNKDIVFQAICKQKQINITQFNENRGWLEDVYLINGFCTLIDEIPTSSKKDVDMNP